MTNTFVKAPPDTRGDYRKTSFGLLPSQGWDDDIEQLWVLIEDYVPMSQVTYTQNKFVEIATVI